MSRFAALLMVGSLFATALESPAQTGTPAKDARKAGANKPVALDIYGDPLPPGAIARMGSVRLRHAAPVIHLAFSPDGKMLFTVGDDNMIRLWDSTTGKDLGQLKGHNGGVEGVSVSPDGKTLATGSYDNTVRLWDIAGRREIQQWRGHQNGIFVVLFSPDGKTVASRAGDASIRLWDVATGNVVRTLAVSQSQGTSNACFAPDGKTLAASTADGKLHVWETATGALVREFQAHQGDIPSVAYSRDGKYLASAGMDMTVRIWEAETGKEVRKLEGHQAGVNSVYFAPDGKILASGGQDQTVILWDTATGKELRRLTGNENSVSEVIFSPDGKTVATAGHDHSVRLWDTATGKPRCTQSGHGGTVSALALSPDGKVLATGGHDHFICFWEAATGKVIRRLEMSHAKGLQDSITALAFSADGKLLVSGTATGVIHVADADTGKTIRQLKGHQQYIHYLTLSADGKTAASASYDQTVRVWDISTGKELFERPIHVTNYAAAIGFSPDGKTLAVSSFGENAVYLWSVATGKVVGTIQGQRQVISLAYSPDGKTLATISQDQFIHLLETTTHRERGRMQGQMDRFAGNRMMFYGYGTGKISFSRDGKVLISTGQQGNTIRLWDAVQCKELGRLDGHQAAITAMAVAGNSKMLATGSADATALVWDLSEMTKNVGPKPEELDQTRVEGLWAILGKDDAAAAYKAIWSLAGSPRQVLPFFQERIRPVMNGTNPQRLSKLITNLDDEQFAVRENATRELEDLGETALGSLLRTLEKRPSLEVQRRIESLLGKLKKPATDPETVRTLRALEVLEHIANPEARRLLEALAGGVEEAKVTQEAKVVLGRLTGQQVAVP